MCLMLVTLCLFFVCLITCNVVIVVVGSCHRRSTNTIRKPTSWKCGVLVLGLGMVLLMSVTKMHHRKDESKSSPSSTITKTITDVVRVDQKDSLTPPNDDNKDYWQGIPSDRIWEYMPHQPDAVYPPPAPMELFDTSNPALLARHTCIKHIRQRHRDLLEPLLWQHQDDNASRQKTALPPVLYVDPALHGNIGDNLLTEGTISVFQHYTLTEFQPCHYAQAQHKFRPCSQFMEESDVNQPKIAAWHAGGNWGDLYYGFVQKKRIASFEPLLEKNYNIIGFPQSFFYRSEQLRDEDAQALRQGVERALHTSLETADGLELARQRVALMWREQYSYDQAEKVYPWANNMIVPDIAFQLGPFDTTKHEKTVDVVIFLRKDKESVLKEYRNNSTKIEQVFDKLTGRQKKVTFRVVDWHDSQELFGEDQYFTENTLKLISMGKVIVCDRLHAFISSYLAGVPIVYIDQVSMKITKTTEVAFDTWEGCQDGATAQWERAQDIPDALERAMKYL
mmetsp:Transcript_11478/g.21959  ORF Transcript_11478/g.21959 Transcript_11478/m.21959 type:complete len:507 (+) Transcript_11478:208-1728(+)